MRFPWRRRDRDADLDREIEGHLDLEREEQQGAGLPPDEARRAARKVFGNPVSVREDVREAWGWQWLERLALDVRIAIRLWSRTPGFSAIAIATMALGIGASTALVGQVRAVFWTPLPVVAPQDLRFVAWTAPRRPYVIGPNVMFGPIVNGTQTFGTVSYTAYLAMRDQSTTLSDVACWLDLGEARPVILGELGFGTVQFVSANYFRTLGVRAEVGRTIQPDDQSSAAWSPVAMISHRFWQRTFGGAADVTSRTLKLNGRTFTIIGVISDGFFGVDPGVSPDIFVPSGAIEVAAATPKPLQNPGLWNACRVVARLAPGRTDEEARLDLERILAASIALAPPSEPYDPPRMWMVPAEYGQPTLREGTAAPLVVLLVVVGGLLLAACANIAGLLLARGSARSREIATRLALGATRARVVRQLITESLVLSVIGGMAGLLLAYAFARNGTALLSQFMPTLFGADRALGVAPMLDGSLLMFAVGLSLLAGLLFGAVPAIRATRLDLIAVIKDARTGGPRFGLTGAQAMVAAQTALAVCLLVGAGLFVRTVANLRSSNLGFQADGLLYAQIEPRAGGLAQSERRQFFDDATMRLRVLPGVVSAAATGSAPMGTDSSVGIGNFTFSICTTSTQQSRGPEVVALKTASPNYFNTLAVPMIAGREFTMIDSLAPAAGGIRAVIVNEAFARKFFPGVSPVGHEAMIATDCAKPMAVLTIIGVARDNRADIRGMPAPAIFAPLEGFMGPVTLIVRTSGDPASMIPTVRRAMTELNANTPTFSETPLAALLERQLRRERLLSSLLTLFAGVTMFICCLGIYGMLAYAVERRRQEISVRMAIGAQTRDVVRLMMRESLVPVCVGLMMGALLSAGANRWVAQLLYGVASYDPLILIAASGIFVAVAVAAAVLPTRAAAQVNPVLALRQ